MRPILTHQRSLQLLVGFYVFAGSLHFVLPAFYLPLIPPYFPHPTAINYASGAAEILLALLVARPQTRTLGAWGIVALLVAFVPAHWHVIELGGCTDSLCVPAWVAHARLWVIHPLLIVWAYRHSTKNGPSGSRRAVGSGGGGS